MKTENLDSRICNGEIPAGWKVSQLPSIACRAVGSVVQMGCFKDPIDATITQVCIGTNQGSDL